MKQQPFICEECGLLGETLQFVGWRIMCIECKKMYERNKKIKDFEREQDEEF
jgi:hypothetical protein